MPRTRFSRLPMACSPPPTRARPPSFSRADQSETKKSSPPPTTPVLRWFLPAFGTSGISKCVSDLPSFRQQKDSDKNNERGDAKYKKREHAYQQRLVARKFCCRRFTRLTCTIGALDKKHITNAYQNGERARHKIRASPSQRIDQLANKQCCNCDTLIAENLFR